MTEASHKNNLEYHLQWARLRLQPKVVIHRDHTSIPENSVNVSYEIQFKRKIVEMCMSSLFIQDIVCFYREWDIKNDNVAEY